MQKAVSLRFTKAKRRLSKRNSTKSGQKTTSNRPTDERNNLFAKKTRRSRVVNELDEESGFGKIRKTPTSQKHAGQIQRCQVTNSEPNWKNYGVSLIINDIVKKR